MLWWRGEPHYKQIFKSRLFQIKDNIVFWTKIIQMSSDWIDYLRFYVPLKNFSLTIAGEGLHNLGLCSALRALEQEGIFILPHLL
jgi:hypothetical protein